MKAENRHITDDVLVKYLLGEASEAEQTQVQEWLHASDDNKKYYAHFKLIWNESRAVGAQVTTDADEAWARFKQRTRQTQIIIPRQPSYRWAKIAAMLLLLAGGSWLAYFITSQNKTQTFAYAPKPNPVNEPFPAKSNTVVEPVVVTSENVSQESIAGAAADTKHLNTKHLKTPIPHRTVALKARSKFTTRRHNYGLFKYDRTNDFICNSTPCPIEICIIQTIKCPNGEPAAVSTCSVLEPDESGQLRYKAFDAITRNCKATVDEIRIKRVSTGETLVLNAESKPTTAQEFFSYITGQKKGGVIAGMFHTDCNNNQDDCGLTFDNSNLTLQ
jgi:hypothetical protein